MDLLAEEFSELARTMQAETSVQATLDVICRLILAVVPSAEAAGITVVRADRFRTIAATSDLLRRIDELQYETGQGPCVDAITEHEVFRTGDLAKEDRWPDFAQAGRGRDRRAQHAVDAAVPAAGHPGRAEPLRPRARRLHRP